MVGLMRSPSLQHRECHQVLDTDDCFLPNDNAERDFTPKDGNFSRQARCVVFRHGFLAMEDNSESEIAVSNEVTKRQESKQRHKFGRLNSRGWFNKSFDQAALPGSSGQTTSKSIKRQNSVSDFFQHVLNKSRSHIQDLFSARLKEKPKRRSTASGSEEITDKSDIVGAEGGVQSSSPTEVSSDQPPTLHSSCPSFKYDSSDSQWANPVISFDPDPSFESRERRLSSISNRCYDISNFHCDGEYRPIVKNPGSAFTSESDLLSSKRHPSSCSPIHLRTQNSPSISPIRNRAPKIAMLPSFDFAGTERFSFKCDSSLAAGGSKPNTRSLSSALLSAEDEGVCRSKRALVKSNSDTFARLAAAPQSLAKASSDGDCFKKSPSASLASSMTSLGSIMCGVTDYLFLGSVEAAYNDPLLCKYNISSLVDMSNISPSAIPALKKSDCPCACVNKTHFRSKLNIGINDIEWENIEQYFDDINAFINGARKNNRRVLVFSYLGQSRAPAAVIQHLMQHFRMSYDDALKIVRAKRAQVKLNSGFVKALCRLEQRLNLQNVASENDAVPSCPPETQRPSLNSLVDIDSLSVPPVVKGAWLEC
ncbi:mucin-5AC [Biomphalaria glabrata]|nr:mucin-5AC [Biomphalaria glabrata]